MQSERFGCLLLVLIDVVQVSSPVRLSLLADLSVWQSSGDQVHNLALALRKCHTLSGVIARPLTPDSSGIEL